MDRMTGILITIHVETTKTRSWVEPKGRNTNASATKHRMYSRSNAIALIWTPARWELFLRLHDRAILIQRRLLECGTVRGHRPRLQPDRGEFEVGRFLHLKSEIRNLKLDGFNLRFRISDLRCRNCP